jgi:geranylgeranyl diphosphate synthase type II
MDAYRKRIEAALKIFVSEMGEKNRLRDACEYALLSGGKRLRPQLVLMIGEALGSFDVMPAALSVEFFHTASLIADDLPCMDNDGERRGRPSLHKMFGETVAVLASYALIAEGYGGIYRAGLLNPKADLSLCLEAATRCAGLQGATNGQFLDLYPPDGSLETVLKVIRQKTVTLFEISATFGWIFGGGGAERLEEVKKWAHHLGMAFQIADDLLDAQQDEERQHPMNLAVLYGKETAKIRLEEEMDSFTAGLKSLGLWNGHFQQMEKWLRQYASPELVH